MFQVSRHITVLSNNFPTTWTIMFESYVVLSGSTIHFLIKETFPQQKTIILESYELPSGSISLFLGKKVFHKIDNHVRG